MGMQKAERYYYDNKGRVFDYLFMNLKIKTVFIHLFICGDITTKDKKHVQILVKREHGKLDK